MQEPWMGGEEMYRRDRWTCVYCMLDGRGSFAAWQSLTGDHLLPVGHPRREETEFLVTACEPCNKMLSRYQASEDLLATLDRTRLVGARSAYLKPRRDERENYWRQHVALPPGGE